MSTTLVRPAIIGLTALTMFNYFSDPQPRWSLRSNSCDSSSSASGPRPSSSGFRSGQDVETPNLFTLSPHNLQASFSTLYSKSPEPPLSPRSPIRREPSPQPPISPRLLSPRNHAQELRRSNTDAGQSIYVSPLLRTKSPLKREQSPEQFIRPAIEIEDNNILKPIKSPGPTGRISPRRSPLQERRIGQRKLPESLSISPSRLEHPPKRISPLAKAYSEEPKVPPGSPNRPQLKSFSSQGSQETLPKLPSQSKFFQEIAKKMAAESSAGQSKLILGKGVPSPESNSN